MATFQRFYSFTKALAEKKFNLSTDTIKVTLTNVDPAVATNTQYSQLTEIASGNGYTTGGATSTQSVSSASGVYKLVLADVTWTATPSGMAAFRYAVIYSDTATNKDLIGMTDYGSSITVPNGASFVEDFDGTNGAITI